MWGTRRRGGAARRIVAALGCALLAGTACGSTRSEADHAAAAHGSPTTAAGAAETATTAPATAGDAPATAEQPVSGQPAPAVASGAARPAATPAAGASVPTGRSASGAPSAPSGGTSGGTAPSKAAGQAKPGGGSADAPAQSPAIASPTAAAKKSPVKIGSVGTVSGFVGEMFKGSLTAVQIWARWINDQGGVNGHPVVVAVCDDGGDPARHRSCMQQMVEKERVIAIVGDNGFITLREDSVRYLEQKRVPVVGGDGLGEIWVTSPMMFPQLAAGNNELWSQMVAAADTIGRGGKFGYLVCSESAVCQDGQKWWPEYAKQNGLAVVYGAQMSMTQPNFTAECLAARNAGVQFLMLGMDTNSQRRVVASCEQQGYHPVFGLVQARAEMAGDRGIDGAVLVSNVFPFPENDTPATREFHDVMAKYAPNVGVAYDVSQGWVTAKVFEKAAANLPDNPTSEDVLRGLWAMRNETLGGLSGPLTFIEGQPAAPLTCYWPVRAKGGQWVAPTGGQGVCKPKPAP